MLTDFLIKYAIGSKIKAILAFILRFWYVFLVLGICWYCRHEYNLQVARADTAVKRADASDAALAKHISDDETAYQKQLLENGLKAAEALKKLNKSEAANAVLAVQLGVANRALIAQNLKDLYEPKQNPLVDTQPDYINQLRWNIEHPANITPAEAASNPERLAADKRDCDAGAIKLIKGYDALEKACILTTIDYNRLRAWGNGVCEQVECVNE